MKLGKEAIIMSNPFTGLKTVFLFAFVFLSMGSSVNGLRYEKEPIIQYHHNILMVSDMTNRLELYPTHIKIHDTTIIRLAYNLFGEEIIHTKGRRTGQMDCLAWSTLVPARTGGERLAIDLSGFDSQLKRINYTTHTKEMHDDINGILSTVRKTYENRTVKSGDIYSFLENELNEANVRTGENVTTSFGNKLIRRHDNVVILFSDGYLEYGLNQEGGVYNYEWSEEQIRAFRHILNKEGRTVKSDLSDLEQLPRIMKVDNPYLSNIRILCLGFHDRSSSSATGSVRVRPSDRDINMYAWKDWLLRSGVKDVEIHGHLDSEEEVRRVIMNFIGE